MSTRLDREDTHADVLRMRSIRSGFVRFLMGSDEEGRNVEGRAQERTVQREAMQRYKVRRICNRCMEHCNAEVDKRLLSMFDLGMGFNSTRRDPEYDRWPNHQHDEQDQGA